MRGKPQGEVAGPKWLKWPRLAWTIIVAFSVLLGIATAIPEARDRIWPAPPDFSPGAPLAAAPLDVPFTVKNKNWWRPISELTITCHLLSMTGTHENALENLRFTVQASNIIEPGQSRPYTCPLGRALSMASDDRILTASLEFETQYKSAWPLSVTRTSAVSPLFSFDRATQSWQIGVPLR